ncbi:hypothetical protein PS15m_007179 [Mucor circinelloides]
MSQHITEVPMATVANHPAATAYPALSQMSIDSAPQIPDQTTGQCEHHRQEDSGASSSTLLRLRGGGCITDCLAAIGCCCICEECCC